jgi:anti-sigma B factor antagonist
MEIEDEIRDDVHVIRVRGELDLASASLLEARLLAAEASGAKRILLDIDGLSYVDSRGLQVILRAKRRADADGFELALTRGQGHVADMFRLTALDRTLPFVD